MPKYTTIIQKFGQQGEKTGWTYIQVPGDIAEKLKPGNKKSFRVKGKLDNYPIKYVALLPMGDGSFIMAINGTMRKGLGKKHGAMVVVDLQLDESIYKLDKDFLSCLDDEPSAKSYLHTLPKSHQDYFSKWIQSAKTKETKAKRIAMAVNALARRMGFPEMLREGKMKRET